MKNEPTSARVSRRSAGMQSALNLALVIFILLMINYLGFKWYTHSDLSVSQFYALSPKTVDVLKKLDSPLRITTLLLNKENAQYWDQTLNLLKEYQRIGGKNVTLERVDPIYQPAQAAELQKRLQFGGADNLVIFEYKGHSRFIKQSDLLETNPMTQQVGGYKGEQQFTASILALTEGKTAKIYFTAGHGEHGITDSQTAAGYGYAGTLLKDNNLQSAELNLAQTGDVPKDADAVAILGPSVAFAPGEAAAIDRYLAANGKLLLMLDPFMPSGLDDVLKKYGLSFDSDIVLYRGTTATGTQATLPLALIYQTGFAQHPITEKFPQAGYFMEIVDARSIHIQADNSPSPKAMSLLQTGPDSWGWVNKGTLTNDDVLTINGRTFNKATDVQGPLSVSALYDGGSTTNPTTKAVGSATRIVLVGAAHFLENDAVRDQQVGMNFFTNVLDWLTKTDAVLDISPKQAQQYGITISPMQQRTVTWTALFFVPGLALALGIFTWISRRK